MIVYVGYTLSGEYSTAVCMGLDKNSVQEKLNSYPTRCAKWVGTYELSKNRVIEFD